MFNIATLLFVCFGNQGRLSFGICRTVTSAVSGNESVILEVNGLKQKF